MAEGMERGGHKLEGFAAPTTVFVCQANKSKKRSSRGISFRNQLSICAPSSVAKLPQSTPLPVKGCFPKQGQRANRSATQTHTSSQRPLMIVGLGVIKCSYEHFIFAK